MRASRVSAILVSVLLLVPLVAQAGIFPDVPDTHVFRPSIEGLVKAGVISGNPDGTFRPGDPVNRAAMLKMLYLASGKTPVPVSKACFPDVQQGSWYESFVCDAAAQAYVKGYTDGTFKPARPVSRAEALKMVLVVFGMASSAPVTGTLTYTDIPVDAWFFPFVSDALRMQILPLIGREDATVLNPQEPIDRAEAAALIWNAGQKVTAASASSSVVSSASSATSSPGTSSAGQASSRKQATFDDTGATADVITMKFPFTDTQRFHGKKPFSYRFTAEKSQVVDVKVTLRNGSQGNLSCTLFRLENDGLSTEYYLGYQENGACYLHTAVRPGNYQLQLQPAVADAEYLVESSVGSGDGNDGFTQATVLLYGKTRVDVLEANDLEDWFTFTVTQEKQMTVSLSASDSLRCIINPGSNVDLFGFEGPACNAPYTYPTGTYYVGIGHASPKAARQMYTLELK